METKVRYTGIGAKTIVKTAEGAVVGGLIGLFIGWLLGKPLEGALGGGIAGSIVGGAWGYTDEKRFLEKHEPYGYVEVEIRKQEKNLINML